MTKVPCLLLFATSAGDLPYSVKLITQPDSSSDDYSFLVCYIPVSYTHLSASSFVLISSASALDAPFLTTLGAPSTISLASLRPKPVTSRTTLITLTLFGPTSASSTSVSYTHLDVYKRQSYVLTRPTTSSDFTVRISCSV